MVGYRVELAKGSTDVFERFSPGLQKYGTATTNSNGHFRVTGAPVVNVLVRTIAPAGYEYAGKYIIRDERLCADRVRGPWDGESAPQDAAVGGVIDIWKQVTGLSVAEGATVAPGPLSLSWSQMSLADGYCVDVRDAGSLAESATCRSNASGALVTSPTYQSPALVSGRKYSIGILAMRGTEIIGQIYISEITVR